jgi:hypothetical protein
MRDTLMDADGQRRLGEYFDGIGDILSNKRRRASFAMYAMGLLDTQSWIPESRYVSQCR